MDVEALRNGKRCSTCLWLEPIRDDQRKHYHTSAVGRCHLKLPQWLDYSVGLEVARVMSRIDWCAFYEADLAKVATYNPEK